SLPSSVHDTTEDLPMIRLHRDATTARKQPGQQRKAKQTLDYEAGKRNMNTPRRSESGAARLYNNLSDNLCGHSK
ncbi:hypothetical protein, partial [Enterobacter hormaechei]|uniref:hypothetical protein n=1 Tax=Enterobacter hormaechei TaxID=158836 RepID=UPI002E2C4B8F